MKYLRKVSPKFNVSNTSSIEVDRQTVVTLANLKEGGADILDILDD